MTDHIRERVRLLLGSVGDYGVTKALEDALVLEITAAREEGEKYAWSQFKLLKNYEQGKHEGIRIAIERVKEEYHRQYQDIAKREGLSRETPITIIHHIMDRVLTELLEGND